MKHPTPPPKRTVFRESQKEEFIQPRVCCLQKPPFWERWRWRQWREIPKPQWRMRMDGRGLDTQGRRKGQKRKGVLHQKRKRNGNTVLEKKWKMDSCANPAPKIERMVQIRKSRIVKGLKHSAEMERISRSKTSFK